jgi:N,N'-diacetyllegionaminate synthase
LSFSEETRMHPDKIFIIAEAGVNHNGSVELAKRLVDEAVQAGADCVKFQTFSAERLASLNAEKASYQKENVKGAATQYEMLRSLELSLDDHRTLFSRCAERGIVFMSSPFDEESADLLEELGVGAFKIPSGEITNLEFVRHVALKKRPIILSTGMSTLAEVAEAVDTIRETENDQLWLLHCVTEYPAPVSEINLRAMVTLEHAFGFPTGYSDHTPGSEIAIAAAALGAQIIEKHFTLDRAMPGPDHKASLDPGELAIMIRAIRNVEKSLGSGIKAPAPCEVKNISIARKSLVTTRRVMAGEVLSLENVAVKRPGNGIQPKDLDKALGLRATRTIESDNIVRWSDLK